MVAASRTRRRRLMLAALLVVALTSVDAREPAAPGYTTGTPSPDGIGTRYLGREIAGVMGWRGAAWLERNGREQEERTDLLVAELHIVVFRKR